jgi:hypothetical protein
MYKFKKDLDNFDVSDVKIIYFLHIPKTSGSSLEPSSPIEGYYTPELIEMVKNKCRFELETFKYNFEGSLDDNYFITL